MEETEDNNGNARMERFISSPVGKFIWEYFMPGAFFEVHPKHSEIDFSILLKSITFL